MRKGKVILNIIRDYLGISVGSCLMGLGIGVFLVDAKVVPGGVSGLSMAVHFISGGSWPVGVLMWLFNLPLFLWGIAELGKRFGVRTFVGFTLTSFFVDFFRGELFFCNIDPLNRSRTIQDLLQNDFFFLVLCGAVLIGLGLGVIFKFRASTGGSDIIAAIFRKRWGLKPGQVIMFVDFFVISFAAFVLLVWRIEVQRPVMALTLYAFFLLFVSSYLVDVIIDGFGYARAAIIISDRSAEIAERIMDELTRGATALKGRGLYRDMGREVLFTVVTRREIALLTDLVKDEDPDAFLIINDVHEVLGNGFRRRA